MTKVTRKMIKMKLELGDTLTHYGKRGTMKHGDHLGDWDVIRVNRKSIVLQNWPTYERRVIKFT